MRILELYSGIGGMHYALKESGAEGSIIAAMDINPLANSVYQHNFPLSKVINKNIESLDASHLKKLNINGILMSPPCQPFTRQGLQKDEEDNRTKSLFHVLEIIKQLEDLKIILLENVVGFEISNTRNDLIETIREKFNYKEFILSPCQFGIPNSRRRYYLIAKRKDLYFPFNDFSLIDYIPKEIREKIDRESSYLNKLSISDFLKNSENSSEYDLTDKTLEKRLNVLDIRGPDSSSSCCFTKNYFRYAEGTGSVYSFLPEEDLRITLDQIETTEDREQRLELIRSLKLRYFTPKEVANLMSFPQDFSFPESITVKQKYRFLGNSINVHVVSQLIRVFLISADGDLL